MKKGKVYLVGAGPGDPELITVKGLKCIQEAEVIVYDRLVNDALLLHAQEHAERIYCGKAPGFHYMKQEEITRTLIHHAENGKIVTRLKGGDPFIFGRGGEELLALRQSGISCEVVPGITSGIGAPAALGIPVTYRRVSGSFACVTGSRCHGNDEPDWRGLAHAVDTLVVYMGMSNLAHIREQLLISGTAPSTPVAFIEWGTTDKQRLIRANLADMLAVRQREGVSNPAIVVIGEAAGLRLEEIEPLKHEGMNVLRQ